MSIPQRPMAQRGQREGAVGASPFPGLGGNRPRAAKATHSRASAAPQSGYPTDLHPALPRSLQRRGIQLITRSGLPTQSRKYALILEYQHIQLSHPPLPPNPQILETQSNQPSQAGNATIATIPEQSLLFLVLQNTHKRKNASKIIAHHLPQRRPNFQNSKKALQHPQPMQSSSTPNP